MLMWHDKMKHNFEWNRIKALKWRQLAVFAVDLRNNSRCYQNHFQNFVKLLQVRPSTKNACGTQSKWQNTLRLPDLTPLVFCSARTAPYIYFKDVLNFLMLKYHKLFRCMLILSRDKHLAYNFWMPKSNCYCKQMFPYLTSNGTPISYVVKKLYCQK